MTIRWATCFSLPFLLLIACADPEDSDSGARRDYGPVVDAGHVDAGNPDAAHPDAAQPDAAHPDATVLCLPTNEIDALEITADKILTKACSPYAIDGALRVNGEATLTLEPGVELQFTAGSIIEIGNSSGGRIVAQGTAAEPILLTSAQTSPTAGSWYGLNFEVGTLDGSLLDYVQVRYAGQDNLSAYRGCVTVDTDLPGRVSITNSTFGFCQQAGVTVIEDDFRFNAFAANTFEDCEAGLWVRASNVGSVDGDQTYTNTPHNILHGNDVPETTTWHAQEVPWIVTENIHVRGVANPMLTIAAGGHYRFDGEHILQVADSSNEGGLVVAGESSNPVIFESDEANPTPGTWYGIHFDDDTLAGSSISYSEIRHAGYDALSSYKGCVTVDSNVVDRVSIDHTTFTDCMQAGVDADNNGFKFVSFTNNTFNNCDFGMRLNTEAVGSVDNSHTYTDTDANLIVGDDVLTSATWKAQSVPYLVDGVIRVRDASNPILTVEAGSVLRFEARGALEVASGSLGGGLVAAGVSGNPVVFESRQPGATPGSWYGLSFYPATLSGTQLTWTEVRHAGFDNLSSFKGCLTIDADAVGRIAVDNSSFTDCLQAGVAAVDEGFSFVSFSGNTFTNCTAGLHLHPEAVGSVPGGQTFASTDRNLMTGGDVSTTATWAAQSQPWYVSAPVRIRGTTNPVVTMAAGGTYRMDRDVLIEVGGGSNGGGLQVAGTSGSPVVFESDQAVPTAGSWYGFYLTSNTLNGTLFDYAVIRHAGRDTLSTYKGGITLNTTASRVTVQNSTFEQNTAADIWVDCDSNPTLSGNTYDIGMVHEGC